MAFAGGYLAAVGGAALAWTAVGHRLRRSTSSVAAYLVGVVAAVDVDAIQTRSGRRSIRGAVAFAGGYGSVAARLWRGRRLGTGSDASSLSGYLQAADCYLVTHALAAGYGVVTHEVRSASRKKIKLPDVCDGLDVECLTPFALLRREQARFVLRDVP